MIVDLEKLEIDYTMTGDDRCITNAKMLYSQIWLLKSHIPQYTKDISCFSLELNKLNELY